MLLAVLEVVAPQFKHFKKLREFIEMKLPPGFPVQVQFKFSLYCRGGINIVRDIFMEMRETRFRKQSVCYIDELVKQI